MIDIRNDVPGLWCDDITFCQEKCTWKSCPRNQENIRDRTIPHSFFTEIPGDCPKLAERRLSLMTDRKKVIEWLEFDYLPRVGAYRKDCEIDCDACMPKHNGDNYCDIDMLGKILALLKEQEGVKPRVSTVEQRCGNCNKAIEMDGWKACPWCGKPILWEAVGRSVK